MLTLTSTRPHTQATQRWGGVGSQGISWIVEKDALPLLPGGIITITVNDAHYVDEYSHVVWPLLHAYPQAMTVSE